MAAPLGADHLIPGGGYGFFVKKSLFAKLTPKNSLLPNVCEKNSLFSNVCEKNRLSTASRFIYEKNC